jgi:hypothetical protein
MNVELLVTPMHLTENEINNLIYSLIKFGFRKIKKELNSPPNTIIKSIMFGVMDEPTVDNIIDRTLVTVVDEYRIQFSRAQTKGIREHMRLIANLFMSEPFELRSDLGEDKDADEFITKH